MTPLSVSLQDKESTLMLINNITTGLSFLGIAYFYYLYRRIKQKSLITRLVSNLILSDLAYSTANFLSNFADNTSLCTVEGFVREYSQLTTLFWAMTLAFTAFAQTVWGMKNLEEKYWLMKLLGYSIPLLFSIVPFIPFFNIQYGKMWVYCWIINDPPGSELPRIVSISMIMGHIWIAIVLVTYWYARIYFFARNMDISAKKLFIYPMILLISFFPVIIDSFLSTTALDYISAVIHMATQHSNGFLNAITYGFQTANSALKSKTNPPENPPPVKSQGHLLEPSLNQTVRSSEIYENNDFDDIENSLRKELLTAQVDLCDD